MLKARRRFFTSSQQRYVITQSCPDFAKPPLKSGHGWIIISHRNPSMRLLFHASLSWSPFVKGSLAIWDWGDVTTNWWVRCKLDTNAVLSMWVNCCAFASVLTGTIMTDGALDDFLVNTTEVSSALISRHFAEVQTTVAVLPHTSTRLLHIPDLCDNLCIVWGMASNYHDLCNREVFISRIRTTAVDSC